MRYTSHGGGPCDGALNGAVMPVTDDLRVVEVWPEFAARGKDDVVIESVSTLRFRGRAEIESSLVDNEFEIAEVRDAPDRPGLEFVFLARRSEDRPP